jgi:hypothetical protein
MPQDSTVLIEEVLNESVEPVSTTSEPVISSNLSHESSLRLMGNLKSYTDRFHQRDLRDSEWGYLRAIQGLRAAKMDYAAIREDFHVLEDMHVPALHIANIFSLAQSVMSKGLLAPIQPPRMPGFIAKEIATPLLKRLDAYYNRFASISFTNQYSELSTRLARYVKDGDIIRVTNALNLAILASVRAVDVRPIFYEAYKALGGTN